MIDYRSLLKDNLKRVKFFFDIKRNNYVSSIAKKQSSILVEDDGRVKKYGLRPDEQITELLQLYKSAEVNWEKVLEAGYREFLDFNSVIIDVGGHAGRHSNIFLNDIKCKFLYVFEPLPNAFSNLENKYSSCDNVKAYNFALGDRTGKSEFVINHAALEESGIKERVYNNPETKNLELIEVDLLRLDDFSFKSNKIDYIKIDIEGGEIDCIRGAKSTLKKYKPVLSIEYGYPSYSAYGYKSEDLYNELNSLGYVLCDLFGNPFLSIDEWNKCVDSYYWDYYAVHKSKLAWFVRNIKCKIINKINTCTF